MDPCRQLKIEPPQRNPEFADIHPADDGLFSQMRQIDVKGGRSVSPWAITASTPCRRPRMALQGGASCGPRKERRTGPCDTVVNPSVS